MAKIYKAQGIGDKEITSLQIEFSEEIPHPSSLEEGEKVFERDGVMLESLLWYVLPGGTYCRLLGEMLRRKASHFIVSHGGLDERERKRDHDIQ